MARYIASEMGYFLVPFLLCAISGFSFERMRRASRRRIYILFIVVISSLLPVALMIGVNQSGSGFGGIVLLGFSFGWLSAYLSCKPRNIPVSDERFFEMADTEFENGRNSALWVKCVTMTRGDEIEARYKYIEEAARRLGWKGEFRPHRSGSLIYDDAGFFHKLLRGDYGLAKTFWLGLVCWRVFENIAVQALIPDKFMSYQQKLFLFKVIPLIIFVFAVVDIILIISTWRASSVYRGPFLWTVSTKLFLIISTLSGFIVMLLYVIDLTT